MAWVDDGALKMKDLIITDQKNFNGRKMHTDLKMAEQVAGLENARLEHDGPKMRT